MKEQGTRIEITSRTIVKAILLVIATFAIFTLKDLVLVVLTAVVIASAVEPFIQWFRKKGIYRIFSVLIVYGIVGSLLVGSFYTFVPRLLQDSSEFLSSIPQYFESSSLWNPLDETESAAVKSVPMSLTQNVVGSGTVATAVNDITSIRGVLQNINEAISSVSAGFVHSASSVFGGVLSFLLIVVLSFYLAVQEDGVEKFLRIVIPDKNEGYVIGLWKRTQTKIGLWMQGQLVLALLVGILVYLVLMVVGVKNALLFAALAALLENIPLFGPIIAAVPAVAVTYSQLGTTSALVVAAGYLIIHQFENHLIYPLVVKKIVGVPPILVILSLLIGFKLAGFLGIILAVPVSAMLVELIDDFQKDKKVAKPV